MSIAAAQPLVAPISKGQRVGVIKAAFDGRPLAEYPLYALEDVAAGGWFGRAWDSARLLFSK
jgi:D-alanyl-D-alanine carboxypeptidase (penicillin-binding protein 5/6)